jgi:hypothetical protein
MPDGFAIVNADEVENPYDGTDVPGEFRRRQACAGVSPSPPGTIT